MLGVMLVIAGAIVAYANLKELGRGDNPKTSAAGIVLGFAGMVAGVASILDAELTRLTTP